MVAEKAHLLDRICVRIRPAAQRQIWHVLADRFAQLPRVLDTSGRTNRAIAAEDDERAEALLPGALGITETELERMLCREERHHAIARHVGAEIDDQMPQVLLFVRADGAVREKYERLVADEA